MWDWDELADQYLGEFAARGLGEVSLRQARMELDKLGDWLRHRRPERRVEEVDAEAITAYVGERGTFKSKQTVRSVLGRLRGMGEFLVREGVWRANPLRWMRGPKVDGRSRVPRRIGREAMEQVWSAATRGRQRYHRRLWVAVLGVLYGTGARRGELERLDVSDWKREEGVLAIDGRKTGWERHVPVPDLVGQCLEGYLLERERRLDHLGISDEPALFVNQWGARLRGASIARGIRGLTERCGMEGVTLHWFRHTCASDLLEDGVHLVELQEYLGHRQVSSTVRYLHVADPQRHRAVEVHPINEMLGTGGGA